MGDRLYVGEAIASLHEEPLIVLQAVGGAQDGEMEPVGVIVLEHLPDTLLEVCGGYDLAKLARREAHLPDVAAGRLYGDVTDVQPPGVQPARSEEHTSELQSHSDLVCRLLLEKKKTR